jgi:A/G-specific adenine glycosylase
LHGARYCLYVVCVTKPHRPKNPAIASALLRWFSKSARDLPWRRTRNPYAIWVSEIMLQQTQVKTVIPYWERWMRELPAVKSLADAKPAKIHKLWEGLGYYTRVRNMQKAAQKIMAEHDGAFPRRFEDILELPGIGRYTAGAISSIAFNEPRPILDGNVMRVLTRVFGIAENPREKSTNEQLWGLAETLVTLAATLNASDASENRCSHLNQSLMELGALICTPRNPNCPACPLRKECAALRIGRVEHIPNLAPRAAVTSREFAAFVVEQRGRWLVRQRPTGVVNAHLWEFPNAEVKRGADVQLLAREVLGFSPATLEELRTIKHSITRYRITLKVYRVIGKISGADMRGSEGRWVNATQARLLAFTGAHGRILRQLTRSRPD